MKKFKSNCRDGILSKGYPHRRHGKNKKRKANLRKRIPKRRKRGRRSKVAIETEENINIMRAKYNMPPIKKIKRYKDYQKIEKERIEKKLRENIKYEQRL